MSRDQMTGAKVSESLENLIFRRQFLLGPEAFTPTPRWKTFSLSQGLILSAHPDLEVVTCATPASSLTLMGFIIDPFNPVSTSEDIIQNIAPRVASLADLLALCDPLSGRWVLLWQDQEGSYIFTDPFGFRQVFYGADERGQWCGSQPEIIRAAIGLEREDDDDLLTFMMDPNFARSESGWIGGRTPYKHCHHLLPNHYLKLGSDKAIRFFPASNLEQKALVDIVETATEILQGSFAAITNRSPLMLPVTAGWDSRVLLAASRSVSEHIEYYIDLFATLPENYPDVWVPSLIAKKLGITFVIKNSQEDLPGWFVGMLAHNVTGARVLPKTRMIYGKYLAQETRINLNGNGSEVCRYPLEEYFRLNPDDATVTDIARALGFPHLPFVRQEVEKWLADFTACGARDFNLLDMLYWEHRIGNWGALYPAEQDIVIEEYSPFNCRRLITTLLAAPRELRALPRCPLYRSLIEAMWSELLDFPVNPPPKLRIDFKGMLLALKSQLRPYIPSAMVNWLKDRGVR